LGFPLNQIGSAHKQLFDNYTKFTLKKAIIKCVKSGFKKLPKTP